MTSRNQKNSNQVNQFLNDYSNAIIAVFLIIFLFVAFWFFLYPKFLDLQNSLKDSVAEAQHLYDNSRKKLSNLQAINESYRTISSADMQKFNSILPNEYVPERLFGEIAEIIGRGGWLLSSINITQGNDDIAPILLPALSSSTNVSIVKGLKGININLAISAINYQGLKDLLKMLENNMRLFDVTNVSFSPIDESVQLSLTTYYYKTSN